MKHEEIDWTPYQELERQRHLEQVRLFNWGMVCLIIIVAAAIVAVIRHQNQPQTVDTYTTEIVAAEIIAPEVETLPTLDEVPKAVLIATYYMDDIPLSYEYQEYMHQYGRLYGCPYPLALAVAEVESNFDMAAVGAAGEVGMMQLNPGADGSYHTELEAITGLDPTTPEGNIAGGCYLLGKYLDDNSGDVTRALLEYNMGVTGAINAWNDGVRYTDYTEKAIAALGEWESIINGWV